ncbi:hypothetical protein, partial [Marinifilum sp. D714]|uniref:hypothetical protein n=1 Tax=Marinifilum sp. D714 TaxID=2937523 RepID=UPI0027CB8CB4
VSADGTAEMWESRSTPTFKESYSNWSETLFFCCKLKVTGNLKQLPTPSYQAIAIEPNGQIRIALAWPYCNTEGITKSNYKVR